jgi:hypothetical protein
LSRIAIEPAVEIAITVGEMLVNFRNAEPMKITRDAFLSPE